MPRVFTFLCFLFLIINANAQQPECVYECSKREIPVEQQVNYFQSATMNKYDAKHLKLDLNIEAGSRDISGSCTYRLLTTAVVDTLVMEFISSMTMDSVYVNGVKKNFNEASNHVNVPLIPSIASGQNIEVTYYYRGNVGAGFYTGTMSSIGLTYTASLSESFQARQWFPAKQILTDKLDSSDVWITTSAANKAGSNGLLIETINKPGGKVQYKWHNSHPINYYLPSIAVGNYAEYSFYTTPTAVSPTPILIQNYIGPDPSYVTAVQPDLNEIGLYINKFSELFGLYPFWNEKYGNCQAAIGGGMEHQTMSTQQNFDRALSAHELAHQWFGDHVTCASWNDIWINEGFAHYGAYLVNEMLPGSIGVSAAQEMLNTHNSVKSQPGGSVYVTTAEAYNENRIFSSRLTYNKGRAIIHTLRGEINDDTKFFNTLKQFQTTYAHSTASASDFKTVAETVSGKNLTNFFNDWYYGEGYPTISINALHKWDSLRITVNQTTSSTTPFFRGLLRLKFATNDGDTTVIVNMQHNGETFYFPTKKKPMSVIIDPDNYIINNDGTVTVTVDSSPMVLPPIPPVTPPGTPASFNVYPNPAQDIIYVTYPVNRYTTLLLYDITGRTVQQKNISGTYTQLTAPIANGIYLIKLTGKNEESVQKIVIAR